MAEGELHAWHFATRQPVRLRWRDGVILELEPTSTPPPSGLWLAPAIIDLQINGFAGVDFQQDGLSMADLLIAVRALRQNGCTRFFLTLITDHWSALLDRLRHLRQLRAQSEELQHSIAGWHLEGPFLSAQPGYCGAHDPSLMCNPTADHLRELRRLTENDPVLLTIAPEREGAIAAIAQARSLGMTVSMGHTNAPQEFLLAACDAGAAAFTHLGNGCPAELNRHDNIVWRVFEAPGLVSSLIPDAIHVSPPLFRVLHKVLSPERIFYTTDAMSAAGAPPGRYRLGKLELEVGPDQVVRRPGSSLFAGSALTPIEGIRRAARMLNCSWREVWPGASMLPARLMSWAEPLSKGAPADFCLLQTGQNEQVELVKSYVRGVALE